MAGYYQSDERGFQLYATPSQPSWRRPQAAALGAILAQWSLADSETPLVSVPTGIGKTAIALAAPFIAAASRVLVVVPTKELRRQTVKQFQTQGVLRQIGALPDADFQPPVVAEISGRDDDWSRLDLVDVAVGIPASVSPLHFEANPPPPDLFDLVIIDEAHHAPATTWQAILDHFQGRALLLTATPHRRDRRRIPGKLIYYFPLRQALAEGLYQPVEPRILAVPQDAAQPEIDVLIADEVVGLLGQQEHQTSQVIVRAGTKARAEELAQVYSDRGHPLPVLHSGLGTATQQAVIDGLRAGTHRGVVMVGMLVEGFDLASLRVAAYHDKHKSLEPTAQLIGRLARVDETFPQPSILVTARDIDVYPHLQGVVRALYDEDNDWASVLPGLIDDLVEDEVQDTEYARAYDTSAGQVDVAHLHPLRRALIYEITAGNPWLPSFLTGDIPDELQVGESFAGQRILYSGINLEHTTLLVVTAKLVRPRWNAGEELDSFEYGLHLASYRSAAQVGQPDLLLLNTSRKAAQAELLEVLGADTATTPGDAGRLQAAFDSLPRLSVSSVGVRNTYGSTRGAPSYRMYAGSSIESGLRQSDTAQSALGHAMVQVGGDAGAFTAGVSTGKSKYWETRYTPLRVYEAFISDLAARYWYPPTAPSGPLLPQISRGQTLVSWPTGPVLAATMDHALIGAEWAIDGHGSLDFVDLHAGADAVQRGAPPPAAADRMALAATVTTPQGEDLIWTGEQDLVGDINNTGAAVLARRGHSNPVSIADLLGEWPPMILFQDGTAVRGRELIPPTGTLTTLPDGLVQPEPWPGVDLTSETKASAQAKGLGISVHEWLEAYLVARPSRAARANRRWILHNDGRGEIADYIVIELLANGQVAVDLWHAKFAGGANPSVRVTDFEVVTSQAVKSRRWPTDRTLWDLLRARLVNGAYPPALLIEGQPYPLEILLGAHPRWASSSLARRKPSVVGHIGIVQPGLSAAQLLTDVQAGSNSAIQIVQLLSVFRDSVMPIATASVVVSP